VENGVNSALYTVDRPDATSTDSRLIIDLDPPVPNGRHGWYVTPVEITIYVVENGVVVNGSYIEYNLDNTGWMTYVEPFMVTSNGEHMIDAYAIGSEGEELHANISFKIDQTPPSVNLLRPEEGYFYLFGKKLFPTIGGGTVIIGNIMMLVEADDETSGVDYVNFTIAIAVPPPYKPVVISELQDKTSPYECEFTNRTLIPDTYIVTADCYDMAGTHGSVSMDFIRWL
jgi:hypothetical protein